jgi:Ca-activated chloride channel family protein
LLLDRTRDGDSVLNKLTYVDTKSQTALYDACYLGVEKVQRGTHPKRALLLISDGQDNDSRYTFNELRKLLKESDVVLYAIGILSGNDAGSSLGMEGQGVLDELSGVSGEKPSSHVPLLKWTTSSSRLRLNYVTNIPSVINLTRFVNDGKWHRVKVKVASPRGLPKLFVRSKEGYYATAGAR